MEEAGGRDAGRARNTDGSGSGNTGGSSVDAETDGAAAAAPHTRAIIGSVVAAGIEGTSAGNAGKHARGSA